MTIFESSHEDRILSAVDALIKNDAGFQEINSLGLKFAEMGRPDIAYWVIQKAYPWHPSESMQKNVDLYQVIGKWQSEVKALRFLEKAVPPHQGGELARTLYERGMYNMILSEYVIPENHPPAEQEYVWLQKLVAWLFIRRDFPEMEELLDKHYEEDLRPDDLGAEPDGLSGEDFHTIGRFLLGIISREELLGRIKNTNQRCVFAYYCGLYERLRENFTTAANWYHICRETLMKENNEYSWASRELGRWAETGLDNRHRSIADDMRWIKENIRY